MSFAAGATMNAPGSLTARSTSQAWEQLQSTQLPPAMWHLSTMLPPHPGWRAWPAYRAKLNSFSDVWFHPRHGQEWRQKYSRNLAAPPVLMPPKTPRELNATRSPRAERSQMLIERGAEGYPEP